MTVDQMLDRANDPAATADALEAVWLRSRSIPFHDRARIRAALVCNPNLSVQRFRDLASQHPLEALDNPAFELYALEEPGWFSRLLATAATAMVLAPRGRHRVLDLAALHPHPMPRLYARHLELIDLALLDRVMAANPWRNWPTALTREYDEVVAQSPRLRGLAVGLLDAGQLIGCPWLPASWSSAALESDGGEELAMAMATRDDLGLARQRHLAASGSRTVRWRLAGNRNIAPEVAARFATDDWHNVRLSLARNPATPDAVLQRLLADPHEDIARAANTQLRAREVA